MTSLRIIIRIINFNIESILDSNEVMDVLILQPCVFVLCLRQVFHLKTYSDHQLRWKLGFLLCQHISQTNRYIYRIGVSMFLKNQSTQCTYCMHIIIQSINIILTKNPPNNQSIRYIYHMIQIFNNDHYSQLNIILPMNYKVCEIIQF